MFRKPTRIALVTALALSTAGAATSQNRISEIDVQFDVDALESAEAREHFASLDSDLRTALRNRLGGRFGDDGARISVELSEAALSDFFDEAYDTAENRLVGRVNVTDMTDNTNFNSYELAIKVDDVTPLERAEQTGTTLAESRQLYYDELVAAFAAGVERRLKD